MLNRITIAAVQMECQLLNKAENLNKAASYIKKAVERDSKLIVLPELFNAGYRTEEKDHQLAETIPGGTTTDWFIKLATENEVYLAGAILERDQLDGIVYDTAILVGPEGYIGKYRKTHLWQKEKLRFTPGEELPVFQTNIGTIGLQICYEVGFPEISRTLTFQGADIIVCTSAFGKPRHYAWNLATRSRALENGVFLVAGNRCGKDKDTEFTGHSRIVDPQGNIINELGFEEGIVVSTINLNEINQQRLAIPYLRDFNKNVY